MRGTIDRYHVAKNDYASMGNNLLFEIARGSVPGISSVHKFGRNPDIDKDSSPEDVWDGGGLYVFPTSGDASHIYADSDSVATRGMSIEVQGLDVDFNLVVQNKSLDASDSSTAVALDTPLSRVFRMRVTGAVDADEDIICGDSGKSKTYAQITAGLNQTLMAIYTIPAGKTGYIFKSYVSLVKAYAANATAEYTIRMRAYGSVFQVKHWGGVAAEGNTTNYKSSVLPFKIPEKTDIIFRIESVTENNSRISAGFDMALVDN